MPKESNTSKEMEDGAFKRVIEKKGDLQIKIFGGESEINDTLRVAYLRQLENFFKTEEFKNSMSTAAKDSFSKLAENVKLKGMKIYHKYAPEKVSGTPVPSTSSSSTIVDTEEFEYSIEEYDSFVRDAEMKCASEKKNECDKDVNDDDSGEIKAVTKKMKTENNVE